MCNNGFNDTGIWMGKTGWNYRSIWIICFMDWNVLNIYRGVEKFYDNVGGLFDAELHHPGRWDF